MRHLNTFPTRLAALLMLQAAGAGLASPTVLVTRPSRLIEWLPSDNQTYYSLGEGEKRTLELNTSSLSQQQVFITISPCCKDLHWAVYQGVNGHLSLIREHSGTDMTVVSLLVSSANRYLLQLSSPRGSAAAVVSVRGEPSRAVRMRLRVRARRRLSANWEPSPIDPQSTTYCVVASHRKNYTSLCAAQYDAKRNQLDRPNRYNLVTDNDTRFDFFEVENKIDAEFNIYEGDYKNVYRRKKFGRSTKATDGDPVIACVGDRTHHVIENLDPSVSYFVSVFGVAKDRRAGSLLATGSVRPRTSTAKRLKENVPLKAEIRGKTVYYFKTVLGSGGGIWVTISTCGGAVDVELLVRGKRIHLAKSIEPHRKFFVPAPIPNSSIQETSDEGSVQFDSSSEESKMRYVIRVTPSRSDSEGNVGVEVTVSTTRWGVNSPELQEDGSIVRELIPRRSCKSLDVAFLPAAHNATDVIRYCISAREDIEGESYICTKSPAWIQCVNHQQRPSAKVITQRISGLRAGRKYAIQVTAANKGSTVPYKVLYADTNTSCKEDSVFG